MSGRDDTTLGTSDSPLYPEDHQGAHFLGVEDRGSPLYYDANQNTVYTGKVESGQLTDEWATEVSLSDRSLSEFLDSESSSWESLSAFAKRHLPGVDTDEDEGDR
ncbi:hypothetical protein [Halomarina rubra]|uniref:Uncharacterized protein n=1 Tax=Halomarina rubra TaxID=2071873 RepID=A0ABD6AUF4_9EURY|nr:hypothetical protein [Halomarina rubra]